MDTEQRSADLRDFGACLLRHACIKLVQALNDVAPVHKGRPSLGHLMKYKITEEL